MSEDNKTTTNFASRLLSKELTQRKKTTQSLLKISPADAAKYTAMNEAETKETVGAKK